MAATAPVDVLRGTISRYLQESFGSYDVDADGDFALRRGSTVTWIRPLPWADGQTIVRIWAITNLDVRVDGELTRFLATESGRFVFGGFHLDEERRAVLFGHTLLGDFLSRKELADAVEAVGSTADHYDDQIKARFGGRIFAEPAGTAPVANGGSPAQRAFVALGLVAAVAAGIASYRLIDDSWWLVAFSALLANYVVGRALGDLVTDPQKARRAVYFALQPALMIGIVYFAYQAWERWWLAALLGFVGGGMLGGAFAANLLPGIHREEVADTRGRWRRAF
ncbi:MAG: hypothetical protein WD249_01150 [Gaiellaceae bacterium]